MTARPLMILGTASHVGKSILTAALGRILSDDGFRVAPFKAQNMSLNSAATPDGREMGRAQALQAEACRVPPQAEMNPVLIKPSTHSSAQVMLLGRIWGQVDASDYYRRRVEELFPAVVESFQTLASNHDIVLLEGAGSPAEINLKSRDIVNLRMARAAQAPCLLVGDIDRGGVFASLLGTLELLDPDERACIRGFIINKFRGDLSLLKPGIRMIEDSLGIPCAGVVPYLSSIGLEEEDSVTLEDRPTARIWRGLPYSLDRPLRIGVVSFPHVANFTDFDALAAEPSVALAYIDGADQVAAADVLILPGSKQTVDDLSWLGQTGIAEAILRWRKASPVRSIVGICGGMQMLGNSINDVEGTESGQPASTVGLGLLPIQTHLRSDKVTRCAMGVLAHRVFDSIPSNTPVRGYEIHLGETTYLNGATPFAEIVRTGQKEGIIQDGAVSADGTVIGTYLHGLFEDDSLRKMFVEAWRARCGLKPAEAYAHVGQERDERFNRLATHVRQSLDMSLIYRLIGIPSESLMHEIA